MPLIFQLVFFALLNLVVVVLGYQCVAKGKIGIAWTLVFVSILLICIVFWQQHAVLKMLAIIATTLTAMKVVATAEWYKGQRLILTFRQWAVFATGWAGMRPTPFEKFPSRPLNGTWPMMRFGISRLTAGLLIVFAVKESVSFHLLQGLAGNILSSCLLLVGLSFILHFGLLSISAGGWRLFGVDTYFLFKSPLKSTSLSEFWGKRWNLAFTEMTAITIFRPLRGRIGAPAAIMASFLFSGVLHELALSVPVNNGYGLPTLYFGIQGAVVLIENRLRLKEKFLFKSRLLSKIWLLFWLVVPAPLLFHPHFIQQVVWPLVGLKP